jgi:hypothetical protein
MRILRIAFIHAIPALMCSVANFDTNLTLGSVGVVSAMAHTTAMTSRYATT